jgi:hypothetical protein
MTPGLSGLDVMVFADRPVAAHLEGFDTADMLAAEQPLAGVTAIGSAYPAIRRL